MIKRFLNRMGIIRKGKSNVGAAQKPAPATPQKVIKQQLLDNAEIGFVIAKMRQATYQGSEFELFYNVISKLQTAMDKKSK
jgi:hypothetical protein